MSVAAWDLGPNINETVPWRLVARWNDLACCQHHPIVPAFTTGLEGWFGCFKTLACLTRGLKTEAGALHFVGLMVRGMA